MKTLKYQPYQGYHRHPWLWYGHQNTVVHRVRTRSDWQYAEGDRQTIPRWRRYSRNGGSVYEKQKTHRVFRRRVRDTIRAELAGNENVSHHIVVVGDYLD